MVKSRTEPQPGTAPMVGQTSAKRRKSEDEFEDDNGLNKKQRTRVRCVKSLHQLTSSHIFQIVSLVENATVESKR